MDDGLSTTESGDMDQRPKDEDLKPKRDLAPSMAGAGELALDQRQGTEEANPPGVRAEEEAASESPRRCQGRIPL